FGKQIKSQVLENNTRMENMRSIDLGSKGWRARGPHIRAPKVLTFKNALKSKTVRKNAFRLNPFKTIPPDFSKFSDSERAVLGSRFMQDYRNFVNEYSSTIGERGPRARWHYVHAKNSAISGRRDVS